jgi:hypothetical protein
MLPRGLSCSTLPQSAAAVPCVTQAVAAMLVAAVTPAIAGSCHTLLKQAAVSMVGVAASLPERLLSVGSCRDNCRESAPAAAAMSMLGNCCAAPNPAVATDTDKASWVEAAAGLPTLVASLRAVPANVGTCHALSHAAAADCSAASLLPGLPSVDSCLTPVHPADVSSVARLSSDGS